MKYLNISDYLIAFTFLFGITCITQCDRPDRDQQHQQRDLGVDIDDRRDVERDQQPGQAGNFENERDEMVADFEELRDNLDAELEDRPETLDEQTQRSYDQLQYDRTELDMAIRNLQASTEDNWEEVQTESLEIYDRIHTQYEERSEGSGLESESEYN